MAEHDGPALTRRALLALASGLALGLPVRRARANGSVPALADHDLLDLQVPNGRSGTRRATVLTPKGAPRDVKLPVLVLLHGLGETGSERLGAYAWVERYGLASCASRLMRPPVASVARQKYLRDDRAAEINAQLASRPFGGLVLVCPYLPNVYRAPNPTAALDRYATWLTDELLPAVRAHTPASTEVRRTGLDGCSLGGFAAFEVFLRRPGHFYTCGGVQSAIGRGPAAAYAGRFEQALQGAGQRRLHLGTSLGDPYHDANVQLFKELERRGLPVELRVAPGPHDQPWLRDVGTLEMLLWHESELGG